jgi:pyruvate carboxylase subunit B
MKHNVDVMITAFRDGFQSVYGARVFTDDFLPAVEATREAGITHFEAGGGARFQALYFYCNEDAFDMMDRFRASAGPDANLQTLSRGVNVVGLDSQSSDIIDLHARLFKKHGITTIRNFDALNDVENLVPSGRAIKAAGLRHEVVVALMSLPPGTPGDDVAHTPEFYTATLRKILESGIEFDSVCYKDASGTATPKTVYDSIKAARAMLPADIPIRFHSHDTVGTCIAQYSAALEAGARGLDLSMAPVSGGTCQSDVISMWHALRGTDYDLGFDIDKMREAEEVFKDCMKDYFLPPESKAIQPMIPFSPMPGGALTANTQMLRDNGIMDRFEEIIGKMPEVVKLGGFGTSVTPVSQFYFQQAFNNALFGDWTKIAEGYGKMVLGYFGKTPMEPDPEIVKIASVQLGLEPTDRPVVEINDDDPTKGVAAARAMLRAEGLDESDENIFIAATCKEKGIAFLKGEGTIGVRKNAPGENASPAPEAAAAATGSGRYSVSVDGRSYEVEIAADGSASVGGRRFDVAVSPPSGGAAASDPAPTAAAGAGGSEKARIAAPLPGKIIRVIAKSGDRVHKGDTVLVIEAMKMETELKSPADGSVLSVAVESGAQVATGDLLAIIGD